jgi:uncharacterized protein (DUF1800 family)
MTTRRALFAAALGAVAAGRARGAASPPSSAIGDADPSSLLPLLVRRITFGITRAELAAATSLGYWGYLEQQLMPELIDDAACEARLTSLTTIARSCAENLQNPPNQIVNELIEATILRAMYSKRQLLERVVEFWTDHFNIDVNKETCAWLKGVDDREVIRPNAMGRFSDLLAASASSPAMLVYLDNHISVAGNPNLNYARELMELHTLGVDGGYTEEDVIDVARCFTGWQVYPNSAGSPLAGVFRYNGAQHDNGPKRVLGHDIAPGGGIQDALTVLRILAEHPSTARFIARKLCRRFIADAPAESIVRTVAARFTATGGDLRETLRCLLSPQHLAQAAPRFKRPFHAFINAARATACQVTSTSSLRTQLKIAGHLTFNWTSPDGYPDVPDFWSGLVLPRWNFGALLASSGLTGVSFDLASFFAQASGADALADRINASIFGGEMIATDRDRVRDYLLADSSSSSLRADAIGLAIGSPSFQWY